MKYSILEGAYILAKFPTGSNITITLYKLSDGSAVTLTSSLMSEVATTGVFKWHTSNITTQPTDYTEYLFIATDTISSQYGKFILEKDISNRIWNSLLSDNNIQGTFGGELATKTDIKASAVSNYKTIVTSNIISGINISGTSANLNVRDNIYWTIGEDTITGLTVECIFNIDDTELAGLICVYGRYIGTPSTSHFIQLWAYNYRLSNWEQLSTNFMSGGNTIDGLYEHQYQEDHINRNNNNEVKIRLIHNPSTYNITHRLYLDYIAISGIYNATSEILSDIETKITELHELQGLVVGNQMRINKVTGFRTTDNITLKIDETPNAVTVDRE